MKRFFVTAVYRVTTQSNVILVEGVGQVDPNWVPMPLNKALGYFKVRFV